MTTIKSCDTIVTNNAGVKTVNSKTYFNSYIDRNDYAMIKNEAYKLQITTKQHISNILTEYAKLKRKEIIEETEELIKEIDNKKEE